MTLTDNMSVPQWRLDLRKKQQRKKEEEKRRQREEEERRLAALPPWKRHAEQPKTVIFIDKNNVASEVNLSSSADSPTQKNSQSSVGKQPQTLANGSAPSASSVGGESLASHGKVGRDETDGSSTSGGNTAEPSGVSEEHCTPVQDNPFLKLERKKRRAPPPPKGGSQISVIASNVSSGSSVSSLNAGVALADDKSASINTSKKTVSKATSESSKSSNVSVSLPQSSNKTNKSGPSTGKQTQISTNGNAKQPAHIEQKENLQSGVPKSKVQAPTKVINDSATSSSKDAAKARADTAQNESRKTSETLNSGASKVSNDAQRRTNISELRTLFGSPATGKSKAPSVSQASQQNSGSYNESAKPSDSKPSQTQSTSANAKVPSVAPVGGSQQTNSSSQQSPKQSSVKVAEQKKNDTNSKTFIDNKQEKASPKAKEKERETAKSSISSESKSLPSAGKGSPQRQKPSSDLSASAIISLTNEGPLQKRRGELVRSSSILDEDEVIELTLETPVSPRRGRLNKDSSKEEVERGSAESSQGDSEQQASKRKAPAPPATINGSTSNTASVKGDDGKPQTENATPSAARKTEVQSEIEYPTNFRDPKYIPSSKQKEDVSSSIKRESSTPVVTSKEKLPVSKVISDAGRSSSVGLAEQASFKGKETNFKGEETSFKREETRFKGEETRFKGEETDSGNSAGVAKPPTGSQARSVKTVEKTNDVVKDGEKKSTKSSPATADQSAIPYPHQFRNFGNQQTGTKSKDESLKDIVKPSDMRKASSSSTASDSSKGKGDTDSGGVTTSPFGSIKLRPTKPKDAVSGISVIAVKDNKPKEKVASTGSSSRLIAVGSAAKNEDKKKNVKKFEKVDMIGYNSPSGKPSALKKGGKSPKKQVKFDSKEEDVFEYLSEEAYSKDYDENHTKDKAKEEEEAKKTSPTMNNGLNNGTISDESDDEESTSGLKNNTSFKSGGFHNYAATTLSATDLLMGRAHPEEPREPPKPAPQPEPEAEPEGSSRPVMDGDIFSSAGTAALLF